MAPVVPERPASGQERQEAASRMQPAESHLPVRQIRHRHPLVGMSVPPTALGRVLQAEPLSDTVGAEDALVLAVPARPARLSTTPSAPVLSTTTFVADNAPEAAHCRETR